VRVTDQGTSTTGHAVNIERTDEVKELRQQIRRTRRAVLDIQALEAALPLQWASLQERGRTPAAAEREARFRSTSASYAPVADAPVPPRVHVGRLGPLTWHTPVLSDDPAQLTGMLAQQDFPFRIISQTRQGGLGGVMLDVGANNGRTSIPRVILGDVSAAYCAEPDALNHACLVANAVRNGLAGLVLPDRVAISDREGTAHLYQARKPGGHTLMPPSDRTVPVPVTTLDRWIDGHRIRPCDVSFVKLDAQGSEAAILRGAPALRARRNLYWQVEIDYNQMRVHGVDPRDLFSLFAHTGTHFTDLNRHATTPRVQPIAAIAESTAYLHETGGHTDALLFTLTP
jgi:FkbM family methyltransferase